MLSPSTFKTLTNAVKQSIHIWMEENMFHDCLGKHGEIVDLTQQAITELFQDSEAYLDMAEKEVDYDLDGSNVFTGRYMLWNDVSKALLLPLKDELLEWAKDYVPNRYDGTYKYSEFYAVCWLAYLKTNLKNIKQFYLNEKESVRKLYF